MKAMSSDPRFLLACVALASTFAGCALYLCPNEGAPARYMRRVSHRQIVNHAESVVPSANGQAKLAQAPELLDHDPGMMRRVKPRVAENRPNPERALDRPVNLVFMLCIVAALTGFAHQVWGSSTSSATNEPKNLEVPAPQPRGKTATTGALTRALTKDPRVLLAFVVLAVTLAGCALYLAKPSNGGVPAGYMRRVPRHELQVAPADGHMQLAKASKRLQHWGDIVRRSKPRAVGIPESTQQGPRHPIQLFFMFVVAAALTGFAHQVWGRLPTGQTTNGANDMTLVRKGKVPVVVTQTVALAQDPRIFLAFVALSSTLAGCALYFANHGDDRVPGGYMRRVPRREIVGNTSANALVIPKALEAPPPIHFLFVMCLVAALIAFAHQVWARMMMLHRSPTYHKAPKA